MGRGGRERGEERREEGIPATAAIEAAARAVVVDGVGVQHDGGRGGARGLLLELRIRRRLLRKATICQRVTELLRRDLRGLATCMHV